MGVIVLVAGALGATAGCQNASVCTPGMTVACACPLGGRSSQICTADGTGYGACQCAAGDDGGAITLRDGGRDAGPPITLFDAGPPPVLDGGTVHTPDGGVPGDRILSTLSPSEGLQICNELLPAQYTPTATEDCSFNALLGGATTVTECIAERDDCLATYTPPVRNCDSFTASTFINCTAVTVSELRLCYAQLNVHLTDLYMSASCSVAGTASAPTVSDLSYIPPACAGFAACVSSP